MPASTAIDGVHPPNSRAEARAGAEGFAALYDENVDLVWRALRRFGIADGAIEDAVQEVFLVAFRRLDAFEGRSAISTWLYGIAAGVARNVRRSARRCPETPTEGERLEGHAGAVDVEQSLEDADALRVVLRILEDLDEDKREAFVLSELEGLSAPEIAESLGLNVNTVYARIRAGRAAFDAAVARRAKRAGESPRARKKEKAEPCR